MGILDTLLGDASGNPLNDATFDHPQHHVDLENTVVDLVYNVKGFLAKGDGTTDDTTAIQAAITAAQLRVTSDSEAPIVYFPPGRYVVSSTLTWESAHLVGAFPNNSVRIFWNGAAGGTVIQKSAAAHAGGNSFALMEGLNFRPGTATPGTWVDLRNAGTITDAFCRLREVHFAGCSGDAIKVGDWLNCHWEHLRFDAIGGYAISMVAATSGGTFVLDKFTYDHTAGTSGKGVIHIDNSADIANLGTVALRHGTVEVHGAWTGGKAIVTLTSNSAGSTQNCVGVLLDDIYYTEDVGMADDAVFHHTATTGSSRQMLVLDNCRLTNLAQMFSGNGWPASDATGPPVANWGLLVYSANATADAAIRRLMLTGIVGFDDAALLVRRAGEAANRAQMNNAGKWEWGDGTNAVDTNLYRSAANILKTDDKLITAIGLGVGNSAAATTPGSVTKKIEVFDASGTSLGYIAVYDAIT